MLNSSRYSVGVVIITFRNIPSDIYFNSGADLNNCLTVMILTCQYLFTDKLSLDFFMDKIYRFKAGLHDIGASLV
jgi:hypothetical protein